MREKCVVDIDKEYEIMKSLVNADFASTHCQKKRF